MTVTAQTEQVRAPTFFTQRRWRKLQEFSFGYTLLAPAFILLAVFELYPFFFGAYISMCRWTLDCREFIWFDNYTRAFQDEEVWHAFYVTVMYSAISVPVQLGLGLVLAYLLFQKVRGQEAMRVMFFMPYITSSVASAAVWAYLYSPDRGLINFVLGKFGIPAIKWLGEPTGIFNLMLRSSGVTLPWWAEGPSVALLSVIVYTTWVFVGYDIAIFLAGLGNIPTELYDAAKVDGASGWNLFRHITIPLLSPTTFFLLIITVIGTFKAFNHIYVMTGGGPGEATTNAAIFIFQQMVQANRYGYSAALSFLMFFIILILTVIQNRVASNRVVYD